MPLSSVDGNIGQCFNPMIPQPGDVVVELPRWQGGAFPRWRGFGGGTLKPLLTNLIRGRSLFLVLPFLDRKAISLT